MEERIARINRFTTGWMGYFQLADTPRVFSDLDEWFRRRMRQIRWKEWKRFSAKRRNLRSGPKMKLERRWAGRFRGPRWVRSGR